MSMTQAVKSAFFGLSKKGHPFILALLTLTLSACEAPQEEAPPEEQRTPRPRPLLRDDPWFERVTIAEGEGLHARLASSPSGRVGVAYWSEQGEEGALCVGIEVDDPPREVRWGLSFASWDEAEGEWRAELVDRPLILGAPPGLSLSYSAEARPQLFALAGEPVPEVRYCGGSDLGLYTPPRQAMSDPEAQTLPAWDRAWVVEDSDQAASGAPASDYGYVVGYWPSHARSSEGAELVSYQDVHSGSIQRDDLARADLEVALRDSPSGGWRYEVIDLGQGAGAGTQALFSASGEPLVLYVVAIEAAQASRDRQGVWLARRTEAGWRTSLVMAGATQGTPQAVPYGEGVAVLYFDAKARQPVLAVIDDLNKLAPFERNEADPDNLMGGAEVEMEAGAEGEPTPQGDPWERVRLGDPRYNEGHTPALIKDEAGRLLAAWYRCASAEREACSPTDDAAIFARSTPTQDAEGALTPPASLTWTLEVLERGEEGVCGLSPSLAIEGSGRVWASWRCSRRVGATTFSYQLESARRDPM